MGPGIAGADLFAKHLLHRSGEAGDIVDDQRAALPPDQSGAEEV